MTTHDEKILSKTRLTNLAVADLFSDFDVPEKETIPVMVYGLQLTVKDQNGNSHDIIMSAGDFLNKTQQNIKKSRKNFMDQESYLDSSRAKMDKALQILATQGQWHIDQDSTETEKLADLEGSRGATVLRTS